MYTREELERRIFAPNKEAWIEAALKDYRCEEEAKVQVIENGIILPTRKISETNSWIGGVCDENFNFVFGGGAESAKEYVGKWWGGGVYLVTEDVFFGGSLTAHFGHAILECLSRLWHAVESGADGKIAFISGEDTACLAGLYNNFFELLGIDLKRIVYIEKPTQFRRVTIPDETVRAHGTGVHYKEKYTVVHEKMMEAVKAKDAKKIYLTRTRLEKRDCLNEEYFEEFYRRRGYTVIAPEQLKLEEQVAYMKGADEVACTIGTLSHLALFSRPGTRLTMLLRASESPPVTPQMVVSQAKDLDFYIVDVSFNFMPISHSHLGCFLLGPGKRWKEYLDATGQEYAADELEWDKSRHAYDYLAKWCELASAYRGWTAVISQSDNFDFLNAVSTALLGKPLRREDYPNSFKEREEALLAEVERLKASIADPDAKRLEAEIARLQGECKALKSDNERLKDSIEGMKNTTSWKITRPLRKYGGLLSGRTKGKIRSLLRKRLK